jgi:hypothetical protein
LQDIEVSDGASPASWRSRAGFNLVQDGDDCRKATNATGDLEQRFGSGGSAA